MTTQVKSYAGTVADFGVAPYQHDQNNSQSYFVKLQMDNGQNRTIWAMGLREHIEKLNIQKGESVNLLDMGVQDGSKRRIWEVERHEPHQALPNSIEHDEQREQQKRANQNNVNNPADKTNENQQNTPNTPNQNTNQANAENQKPPIYQHLITPYLIT